MQKLTETEINAVNGGLLPAVVVEGIAVTAEVASGAAFRRWVMTLPQQAGIPTAATTIQMAKVVVEGARKIAVNGVALTAEQFDNLRSSIVNSSTWGQAERWAQQSYYDEIYGRGGK